MPTTKDSNWSVEQDVRESMGRPNCWTDTPECRELVDGAVRVEWFSAVYAALGEQRWQQLAGAAQYAGSSSGHQRAKQFASAIWGN